MIDYVIKTVKKRRSIICAAVLLLVLATVAGVDSEASAVLLVLDAKLGFSGDITMVSDQDMINFAEKFAAIEPGG